jgi:hypothetical protein
MRTISLKNIFASDESKAFEYFGLGTDKELNDLGTAEFVNYLLNESEAGDAFKKHLVEAYKKATKK